MAKKRSCKSCLLFAVQDAVSCEEYKVRVTGVDKDPTAASEVVQSSSFS